MKLISKSVLIYIMVFILVGYYVYTDITREIPRGRPKVILKYNGNDIPSNMGEHNWFAKKDGGNSYMAGSPYNVGQKTSSIIVNPGGTMNINFPYIPKHVKVLQWISNGTNPKAYDVKGVEKKYEFTLPLDKGEYVFEVIGEWDETHNTSDIIRVNIN